MIANFVLECDKTTKPDPRINPIQLRRSPDKAGVREMFAIAVIRPKLIP